MAGNLCSIVGATENRVRRSYYRESELMSPAKRIDMIDGRTGIAGKTYLCPNCHTVIVRKFAIKSSEGLACPFCANELNRATDQRTLRKHAQGDKA